MLETQVGDPETFQTIQVAPQKWTGVGFRSQRNFHMAMSSLS